MSHVNLVEKKAAKTTIIPVAGGKGGVGKSLFTANLAIALSKLGLTTVAVDLDFGASNLRQYLGSSHNHLGVGDYLIDEKIELVDLLVSTKFKGLKFLPGDGKKLFMSNLPYMQKQKLLKALSKIPADYLLLDLGAGCSFNTLDFFSLSDQGILVTTPDLPAMTNLLAFLKSFVFREIWKKIRHDKKLNAEMKKLIKHINLKSITVQNLTQELSRLKPSISEEIEQVCENFNPRIVINMGEHPDDLLIFKDFPMTIQKRLSIQADFFGFVFFDYLVRTAVNRKLPLTSFSQSSVAFEGITLIADRIAHLWHQDLENSYDRLLKHTQKFYDSFAKIAV